MIKILFNPGCVVHQPRNFSFYLATFFQNPTALDSRVVLPLQLGARVFTPVQLFVKYKPWRFLFLPFWSLRARIYGGCPSSLLCVDLVSGDSAWRLLGPFPQSFVDVSPRGRTRERPFFLRRLDYNACDVL